MNRTERRRARYQLHLDQIRCQGDCEGVDYNGLNFDADYSSTTSVEWLPLETEERRLAEQYAEDYFTWEELNEDWEWMADQHELALKAGIL